MNGESAGEDARRAKLAKLRARVAPPANLPESAGPSNLDDGVNSTPPIPSEDRVKTQEPQGFPQPGDVFEDRYQIDALIGTGGFAKVYRATQTDLGREVALKIMLPEETLKNILEDSHTTGGHRLAERFLQEARVVAKLRDPHTVTMHDHGRSRDGLLYMVFEHIDGLPLSRVIRAGGALEPRRVAKILRQALSSLQEAHAMGMLHRDIKPGNIMIYEHVGRPDQVKVLDFGIAKVVGRQQVKQDLREDLTTNGALLGTPRYMSPEQIRGQDLTPASDLYSLGLVAYEMLTGHKAIDSNSSVIVIGAQLDPRSFAVPNTPQVPPGLRMVINRMLEKDRNLRYQTVDDVLNDLNRLDTGSFPAAAMSPGAADLSGHDLPDLSDSIEPFEVARAKKEHQRRNASRSWLIGGIFALCVFIGVAVGFQLIKMQGGDEPAEMTEIDPVEDPVIGTAEAGEGRATVKEIAIATVPENLQVFVNDKAIGTSPVSIQTDGLQFPARIRAVLPNGESRMTMIDSPVANVALDLSMFVEKAKVAPEADKVETAPVVKKTPTKTTRSKTTKKQTQKKQNRKTTPPPVEEKDERPGGLRLPALD